MAEIPLSTVVGLGKGDETCRVQDHVFLSGSSGGVVVQELSRDSSREIGWDHPHYIEGLPN